LVLSLSKQRAECFAEAVKTTSPGPIALLNAISLNHPTGEAIKRHVMLLFDTAADDNFVSYRVAKMLDANIRECETAQQTTVLGPNAQFKIIGMVGTEFSLPESPEKSYEIDCYVVDEADSPLFDVVIGRKFIAENPQFSQYARAHTGHRGPRAWLSWRRILSKSSRA
jgi:hypothetical protein